MAADLSNFERGGGYDGDYDADLAALQERLGKIQSAYISYGNSAIIAVEGWDVGALWRRRLSCLVTVQDGSAKRSDSSYHGRAYAVSLSSRRGCEQGVDDSVS